MEKKYSKQQLEASNTELAKEEKQRMEAVLYAFACKFLNQTDLQEIKEVLSMTVLGEMIWQDGLAKGIKEGHSMGREIERICQVAELFAPDYDCEKIYQALKSE